MSVKELYHLIVRRVFDGRRVQVTTKEYEEVPEGMEEGFCFVPKDDKVTWEALHDRLRTVYPRGSLDVMFRGSDQHVEGSCIVIPCDTAVEVRGENLGEFFLTISHGNETFVLIHSDALQRLTDDS